MKLQYTAILGASEAPKILTFLHLKCKKSPLLGGPYHGCPAQLTSKILVAQTEIWLRGAKKIVVPTPRVLPLEPIILSLSVS